MPLHDENMCDRQKSEGTGKNQVIFSQVLLLLWPAFLQPLQKDDKVPMLHFYVIPLAR